MLVYTNIIYNVIRPAENAPIEINNQITRIVHLYKILALVFNALCVYLCSGFNMIRKQSLPPFTLRVCLITDIINTIIYSFFIT